MIYLLIDILVYNYTIYPSYFFLTNLNNKSLLYNIIIAFILDFIKKLVKKNNNFFSYICLNMFFVITYYLILTSIFSYIDLKTFLLLIIINGIFNSICYIRDKTSINLIG